jgi:predicted nucleic acid-binding protein
VILLDTSGLLAAVGEGQLDHREAAASLNAASPPLLLSPFVLAELDYLLATRVGQGARSRLLGEVERGAYLLEPMARADVARARTVIARHADLAISLADASLVVLAERHGCHEILTLDQRHFRVLRAGRRPFRILPADAW